MTNHTLRGSRGTQLAAAVAALGTALLLAPALAAPEPNKCAELHEELTKADIPVKSVGHRDGEYQIYFHESCPASKRLLADGIRSRVLQRAPIVVDNLQDAVVILRFEPENTSALNILRARYQELRERAAKQAEARGKRTRGD